jgi:hypothetical protein
VSRRRGVLACAGLVVIALGASAIAWVGAPGAVGGAPRSTESMFGMFGGVILIAGGIRLLVGSQKLNQLLKPQRNRRHE